MRSPRVVARSANPDPTSVDGLYSEFDMNYLYTRFPLSRRPKGFYTAEQEQAVADGVLLLL